MRGVTHATVGTAGVLIAGLTSAVNVSVLVITAAVIGSLMPDIDHPGSTITREITPVFKGTRIGLLLSGAILVGLAFYFKLSPVFYGLGLMMIFLLIIPHRGVTHSVIGLLGTGLLAWVFGNGLYMPFVIGYALHLLADMLSGGVPLLWPCEKRIVLFKARTGGLLDYVCLFVGIVVIAYFILNQFKS